MNRSVFVATLFLFTASAHSMTAAVSPATQQPAGPPTAPGTPGATNAVVDARPTGESPAPSRPAAPTAATVMRPAAVMSAPGVPAKANVTQTARPGVARTKANTFMPSAATQAAAAAPTPDNAAWSATAHGSSGMHRGTLEAINVSAGTLQVYGQKLSFNAQRVKVFNRNGRPGSIFAVKSGANVRFTMDAADHTQRRVGVIYID